MTFEQWIIGELDRGLSQLEVDQVRAAWNAALQLGIGEPVAYADKVGEQYFVFSKDAVADTSMLVGLVPIPEITEGPLFIRDIIKGTK